MGSDEYMRFYYNIVYFVTFEIFHNNILNTWILILALIVNVSS